MRERLEYRFGFDFSRVRVHADRSAAGIAQSLGAAAFAIGDDIAFGPGRYQPGTPAGDRLLAHELAHVVQQTAGRRGVPSAMRGGPALTPAAIHVARAPDETRSSVHQRILTSMIQLVAAHPQDGQERLDALASLFDTVPEAQRAGLYERLQPGASSDDFAEYFKTNFPASRSPALAALRARIPSPPPWGSASAALNELSGQGIGERIAEAGRQVPLGVSGAPSFRFGNARSNDGEGYLYNPEFWKVEYILRKGTDRKTFTNSRAQPSAWRQTEEFLKAHPEWHGPTLDIRVSVGRYGAAAAVNDALSVKGADSYAVDCLAAATLTQLRGIYLSYPAATRDEAFDRDYRDFFMLLPPEGTLPSSGLSADLEITRLPEPIPLADDAAVKALLQPGDQVPIENRSMPPGPWRTENVVYLGDGQFFGHPIGVVTIAEYGRWMARQVFPAVDPAVILQSSFVGSFSRPHARTGGPRVPGPGESRTP